VDNSTTKHGEKIAKTGWNPYEYHMNPIEPSKKRPMGSPEIGI
jgi:hypothetical protein